MAGHGKLKPAPKDRAVNGGNHGLGSVLYHPLEPLVGHHLIIQQQGICDLGHLGDIPPAMKFFPMPVNATPFLRIEAKAGSKAAAISVLKRVES
jgi:hypothetical protein